MNLIRPTIEVKIENELASQMDQVIEEAKNESMMLSTPMSKSQSGSNSPVIKPMETGLSPFGSMTDLNAVAAAQAAGLSQISNNPEKFHSHFIKLRSPNRKGQTRYRCVTCSHEFECTGKLRLIQHILGSAYSGNQSKNVRSCPMPYLPLKEALLKIHGPNATGSQSLLSSDSSSAPGTPKFGLDSRSASNISFMPLNNVDVRQPISFDSFYSTKSDNDNTTAEEASRSDHDICEFLTGIGATEEDFLAEIPDLKFFDEPVPSSSSMFTSGSNKRMKIHEANEFVGGHNNLFQHQQYQAKHRMYSIANKAVLQFFSNYQLPVHAVEDPLFLELLSAIRVAGPYYRPDVGTILQDTHSLPSPAHQQQQQQQQQSSSFYHPRSAPATPLMVNGMQPSYVGSESRNSGSPPSNMNIGENNYNFQFGSHQQTLSHSNSVSSHSSNGMLSQPGLTSSPPNFFQQMQQQQQQANNSPPHQMQQQSSQAFQPQRQLSVKSHSMPSMSTHSSSPPTSFNINLV